MAYFEATKLVEMGVVRYILDYECHSFRRVAIDCVSRRKVNTGRGRWMTMDVVDTYGVDASLGSACAARHMFMIYRIESTVCSHHRVLSCCWKTALPAPILHNMITE